MLFATEWGIILGFLMEFRWVQKTSLKVAKMLQELHLYVNLEVVPPIIGVSPRKVHEMDEHMAIWVLSEKSGEMNGQVVVRKVLLVLSLRSTWFNV